MCSYFNICMMNFPHLYAVSFPENNFSVHMTVLARYSGDGKLYTAQIVSVDLENKLYLVR